MAAITGARRVGVNRVHLSLEMSIRKHTEYEHGSKGH
jgi:hypothetical protein